MDRNGGIAIAILEESATAFTAYTNPRNAKGWQIKRPRKSEPAEGTDEHQSRALQLATTLQTIVYSDANNSGSDNSYKS